MNMLATIKNEVLAPATRQAFDAAKVDQAIAFEREAGFAMQIMQGNDYLQKIAHSNLASLRAAVINTASIGVSLNPAKKQAYLVPRDGKVCLDISYMGLLDLATQTGSVLWGQANVVRKADTFVLHGIDKPPEHKFDPFSNDRGEIIGAYCVIKTADGDYLSHTMSIAEIHAIRDRSSAWKSGRKCPWHTDESEMCKKTVIKQASKYWPKNDRVMAAANYLNTEGDEGLERDMGRAIVEPPQDEAYLAYEAERLPALREAAMAGMAALQRSFSALEQSAHKSALWKAHAASLKSAAAAIDDAGAVIENKVQQ